MSQTSKLLSHFKRSLFSISILLLMSSCAGYSDGIQHLSDDPLNEVSSEEVSNYDDSVAETKAALERDLQGSPINSVTVKKQVTLQGVDPTRVIDSTLLRTALNYLEANKSKFRNQRVLTVIDFGKRSTERRMHIIDLQTGNVWSIPTAHGRGSDPNADGFVDGYSNKSGSNATSLGFYKGSEIYTGKNGLSLRMDGLSSTNSNARMRAVVIHGADYVQDRPVVQGRSWGCPAVPHGYRDRVMALLSGGSLIYAGDSRSK